MADGPYRFQTGTAQHFYPQFAPRSRNQLRNSPPLGGRIPFESTSPSRSPGSHSPSRQPYAPMYNTNSHNLMNGGGPRGFGMPLGMSKPFGHQNHQTQQHSSQHQDPNNSHGPSYSHHQHTHSGGMTNGGGHFAAGHMQNGSQGLGYGGLSKPPNDHWALQMQLANQEREWSNNKVNHAYARLAQGSSKDLVASTASMIASESEKEQRQRPGTDELVSKSKNQSWTELDMGGQTIKFFSPSLFAYNFLTKLYFNNNRLRTIPKEIGQLRTLRHLDLSINELRSLPSQIGMLVNLKELLLFDNQLETLPYEIGNLYQCAMLGIDGNPLNDDFKNIVVEQGSLKLIEFLRENAQDIDPPEEERPWHELNNDALAEEEIFTVMNYNTLCHHYCTSTLYGYSPIKALSWDLRRELILNELRHREADIICLQEVEGDAYETFFRPNLAHLDYKGVFWPKGRAKTMGPNESRMVDGCATFYKNNKFILLDKQLIDLPSAAINRPDMKGESDVYNRVMPKDNVAVLTFFENRMSGARMIVVNAHLHWDVVYKDVKVVQVAVLLEAIAKQAEIYSSWPPLKDKEKQPFRFSNGDSAEDEDKAEEVQPKPSMSYNDPLSIPLIITGDFNSLPGSGPHELITNGELPPNHSDLEGRKYGKFTRDGIKHPFQLKSSYQEIGELPFTNYVSNFEGVVDYVWYTNPNLNVRGVLGEIDPEYIARVPGFPNIHFPSDHLALMAEFGVKQRRTGAGAKDKA